MAAQAGSVTGGLSSIAIAVLAGCGATVPAQPNAKIMPATPLTAPWTSVARTGTTAVYIDRTLYERADNPHFFVRFRIVNEGADPIGLDVRAYTGVFYPNQWQASDAPHRTAIDERRIPVPALDDKTRTALLGDFRAGRLTTIRGGLSQDYFRDFNASTRTDVESQTHDTRYLLIVLDGHLDVVTGADVTRLTLSDDAREIAIDVPPTWRPLSETYPVLSD